MAEDNLPDRIKLEEPRDAAFWARYFQVSVEQLRAAVKAVGDRPEIVARILAKKFPNPESGIV